MWRIKILFWIVVIFCPGVVGKFKEVPSNQSVIIGSDVLLRCAAEPSLPGEILTMQWRSNDGELLGFDDVGNIPGHDGRYSYVRDNPGEKHLLIERVALEDDGPFECQMMRIPERFRASAFVTVYVPPSDLKILDHKANAVIEVVENLGLNLTCMAVNAKPSAIINWSISGETITENILHYNKYNPNNTASTFASLDWRPRRGDDGKVITCQSLHSPTNDVKSLNVTLNVLYSSEHPVVKIVGGTSSFKVGDNLTLSCVAFGGNPAPNLTWHLDNRLIGNDFHYDHASRESRIHYSMVVEAEDNGARFECRSWNGVGNVLKEYIQLSVEYAPSGVDLYARSPAKLGENVLVNCRTKVSNPISKITWLVNGHIARSTEDTYHKQPKGLITLSNISVNTADVLANRHQVVVECIAKNSEGSANKQHVIRILAPPSEPVIFANGAETFLEGETLSLACEAHGGNPLASLTWHKGVEKMKETRSGISGDVSQSVLIITLNRTLNNQQIRCEAVNSALEDPLIATKILTVLFPPRKVIIRKDNPSTHHIIANERLKLSCLVPSSNPAANIAWKFLKRPTSLSEQNRRNRSSREHGGYEVENSIDFIPTKEMDGTYLSCIASHPLWNEEKIASFPLTVHYPPVVSFDSPITIVVREGDSFKENITIQSNPPVTSWRWKKDGLPFDHTIGSILAREAVLSGRAVRAIDNGLYSLSASNTVGSVNISIRVIVEYGAFVKQITSPVMAAVGEEVALECVVDGVPKKDGMVNWVRNGKKIGSVSLVGQTRAVLRLNASHETSGVYFCVANNGIGEANQTEAYLLVKKAPKIVRQPSFLRAAGPIGGSATLKCRARAVPNVTFNWYIQGQTSPLRYNTTKYSHRTIQIDHETFESSLWIAGIDQYDYQRQVKCTVVNRLGEDAVEIQVGPLTAPGVPLTIRVINATRTSLALDWIPGFDGGSDQIFEVRYQLPSDTVYRTVNSTEPIVEIKGLQAATRYDFSIRAINKRGFSSGFSRPPMSAYTQDENGVDVVSIETKKEFLPQSILIIFGVGGIVLLLTNCLLLCFMHRRHKRRKLQEKTEMVRKCNGGTTGEEVRSVQMYGALTNIEPSYRPDSTNTNRSEVGRDPASEDDQSIRTMIEVNPNGYMQQVDPASFYNRDCHIEYDFDPNFYAEVLRTGTMRGGPTIYANKHYPELLHSSVGSRDYPDSGSISRMTNVSAVDSPRRIHIPRVIDPNPNVIHSINNNNNITPQMLQTFVQSSGVHTTPIDFSHIDGDLV